MSENKNENTNEENNTAEPVAEESLQEQLAKCKNDFLYLLADFDNFKKNAIKERSELARFGSERLVRELLEVMDNFERALHAELKSGTAETFKSGVEMIFSEMKLLLNKFGVTEIETKGKAFDPSLHEALSSEPTDEVPPGHISQVFKKAYKMHDRIIRPAQVVVSTEPAKG